MDLDYARKQLTNNPTDPDTITNVVLNLLELVGQLDHDLAVERQARQDLERELRALNRRGFAVPPVRPATT